MTLHARLAAFGCALAMLLALVGCGGEEPQEPASTSAPPAPTATTPTRPADVTVDVLDTAEVPAACELPRQRLVNGRTTQGKGAEGGMGTSYKPTRKSPFAQIDLAGSGYQQMLAVYSCRIGEQTQPETLVLIGSGGRLLGQVRLGDIAKQERATVKKMTVRGRTVQVNWVAYDGAGYNENEHTSTVTMAGGKLKAADKLAKKRPALDLKRWKGGDFVTPDGKFTCSLQPEMAVCDLQPSVPRAKIPAAERICPKQADTLDVAWITVDQTARWLCAGGIGSYPVKGASGTRWNVSTKFGAWKDFSAGALSGQTGAVLPYGKTLKLEDYQCTSAEDGVTCKNTATGKGFHISEDGVDFIGQ